MIAFANSLPKHRNTIRVVRANSSQTLRSQGAMRCRKKFLHFFPGGFHDETYLEWERNYKAAAHAKWQSLLNPGIFRGLLDDGDFLEIGSRAVRIESRTNLLFSFEKMAIRDAVRTRAGAKIFAEGLWNYLQSPVGPASFERWINAIAELPRRQTRVLTWPLATVFGFIAQPRRHMFLKPNVTRIAAREYGFSFEYQSRVAWPVYASLLKFATVVRRDVRTLAPRDMIDIQGFIWVQGSDEYPRPNAR